MLARRFDLNADPRTIMGILGVMFPLYAYLICFDMVPIFILWLALAFVVLWFLKPMVNRTVVEIIKVAYSTYFELGEEAKTYEDGKPQSNDYQWLTFQVDNYKVHFPGLVNGMLIFLVYSVWAATAAVFWDTAVVQTRIDECIIGDNFDCYTQESRLTSFPLNCTSFNESGTSLICYKLNFRFSRGISEAGGVMVTSSAIFMVVARVIIFTKAFGKKKKIGERVIVILMAAAQFSLLLILLSLIIIVLAVTPLWNILRSDAARLLKALSIVFTIYALIWVPWYLCHFEIDNKTKKKKT